MFPTQAIIDRKAIRQNLDTLTTRLASTAPVPVIKADAYGHGAVEVAGILQAAGTAQAAVFRIAEAQILRDHHLQLPLWVLLGALPDELDQALELPDLTLAVWSREIAVQLDSKAREHHRIQPIHLKIDTGMGRLGLLPAEIPAFLDLLRSLPNLRLTGAFSHVACADQPQHPNTLRQVNAFNCACQMLPRTCTQRHLAASAAIASQLCPHLPFARPGIALYGTPPTPDCPLPLLPAMTFQSRLVSLKDLPAGTCISYDATVTLQRDSRIAVVPVGYASGLPRALSNRFSGLVRGHRVPLLGTVCMDMTMFDLTDVPDAAPDDVIVLIGRQGEQENTAWDVARLAHTIPYDLFCHIGMTQPRTYIN